MAWKNLLTGSGLASLAAQEITGADADNSVTSTGSTSQANSYAIRKPFTIVTTTGANTGVRLPSFLSAGDEGFIQNNGAQTLFVYPPVGGKINAGSTDAKVDCGTLKGAFYKCIDNLNFCVQIGA